MTDDRISRTIRHLERNSQLDSAPHLSHVQFVRDSVHFYMPNTFHMSPTMPSLSYNKQHSTQYDELVNIVENNQSHVPILITQIERLKLLKEVYYHNYKRYEKLRILMYGNWPIRDVCILGKVMNIQEAEFSDKSDNFSTRNAGANSNGLFENVNGIFVPRGKITNDEYLLFIEDGTSPHPIIARMSSQVWEFMKIEADTLSIPIGTKVKVWGQINLIYDSMELITTRASIVGKPGDLAVETEWWKLCLQTKNIIDVPWVFDPLAHLKISDLDIVISFSDKSIIEIDDDKELGNTIISRTWVKDLDCSFEDYLNIKFSEPLQIPNSSDVELLILESMISYSLINIISISIEDLQNDERISRILVNALTSNMINSWSSISSDEEICTRWDVTNFKLCKLVLLKDNLTEFCNLALIKNSGDDYLLEPLKQMMSIIERKMDLLAMNSIISSNQVKILLKQTVSYDMTDKYLDLILLKAVSFNRDQTGNKWQLSFGGWKKVFNDANTAGNQLNERPIIFHDQILIPTTELIKCSVFLVLLSQNSSISLNTIMKNENIRVQLNKLILSRVSNTCGSIDKMEDILKILDLSRQDFIMMKRKIISSLILLFENSNLINIEYDGYLDRCCLYDYSFDEIKVECCDFHVDDNLLEHDEIITSEIKSYLFERGIFLNTVLTNCLVNHLANNSKKEWHFNSKQGKWYVIT